MLESIQIFQYHIFVAVKKTNRNSLKGSQAAVIFWLVFIIIIVSVFMANAETIKTNFNLFRTRLTGGVEEAIPENEEEPVITVIIDEQPAPVTNRPSEPATQTAEPERIQQPALPPQSTPPAQQTQPQAVEPVRTTDRVVYFTQVSSDGQILQSRVMRRIPVSDSPMMDALNLLLAGPSSDEISRGILNLIPQNTRILSAAIRGTTAYISFNENFLFNTFGVEGYVAQLRQIIWTVTEFQTVNDVQILIEGRRMDYLGEGIWIGSPISRQSF